MKFTKLALVLSFAAISAAASASVQDITLDFENLPGANNTSPIHTVAPNYGGLHWSNSFSVLQASYLPDTGYDHGAFGDWVGYSASGNAVSFNSDPGQSFNFYGVYLASAWDDSQNVVVSGFLNGNQIYSTTVNLTNNPDVLPKLYQFNWKGVDKVSFSSTNHSQVVFDNLQISPLAAVPEPETYALMGLGLVAMGLRLRRKKSLTLAV